MVIIFGSTLLSGIKFTSFTMELIEIFVDHIRRVDSTAAVNLFVQKIVFCPTKCSLLRIFSCKI